MALKDSFINLNKALRTTLQNVPAVVDTLVRGLDGVAEAAEEESTYSTDEKVVGTWIDGSKIYEKTIEKNVSLGVNAWTTTGVTIANIKQIVSVDAYYAESGATWAISGRILNSTIELYSFRAEALTPINSFTIRYTKTSASRSPEENDTRNGGDDVKTVEEPAEELKK